MIQIRNKIISIELFTTFFICDPDRCLGNCCVYGDSGAPLDDLETGILEDNSAILLRYISPEGRDVIKKYGPWVTDHEGDKVTPLIDGKECVYAIFENGVARCGIEKAYYENAISFRKPVSCHLYPVRISKLGENIALNYHHWHICEPARELGKAKGMPVFRFLREAIVRVWGVSFYEELEIVYKEMGNP